MYDVNLLLCSKESTLVDLELMAETQYNSVDKLDLREQRAELRGHVLSSIASSNSVARLPTADRRLISWHG